MVNCNLQRLDGPVRGNGKIIQELEGVFRGAGWNVIKVVWGSGWDPLLAADKSGLLLKDGGVRRRRVPGLQVQERRHVREHFGKYPELLDLVSDMTDDQIWALSRGGHDPSKVYAAYKAAVDNVGTPTVILAKTVKGYGWVRPVRPTSPTSRRRWARTCCARSATGSGSTARREDRRGPFCGWPEGSREQAYPGAAEALGGGARRRPTSEPLPVPELSAFAQLKPTGTARSPRRWRSSGS